MRSKLFVCAAAALVLCSCGDTSKIDGIISSSTAPKQTAASVTASAQDDSAVTSAAGNDPSSASEAVHENDPDELVDLTVLDSNMVYAMVYDMVNYPESYEGQTVRAKGTFAHTEYNGKDYFAVLIADATACCSQGMEFVLKGSYVYPDDYPETDTEIIVEGVFNTYMEDGYRYCQLTDAQMTVNG